MKLTKTDFIAYLDSPRHLWAIKHNKIGEKEIGVYLQHLFEQGYEVERLAEQYIQKHLIPQYHATMPKIRQEGRQTKTRDENLLLQPTYIDEHYEARTDVLILNPKTGKWDMYEIKSSTKVDKTHKYDATFQYLVFKQKFELGEIYILHLDKEYIREGEISLSDLFIAENVNEFVEELKDEVIQLRYEASLTAQAEDMNKAVACIRPKTCPCLSLCHQDLPKYSIYDVNHLTGNESKIRDLEADGIKSVYDIPLDFELSAKQRYQVDVAQSKRVHIDKPSIAEKLAELEYPLYFLDYETFNPAVPMFDGYKPFGQMTFQYSLHVLKDKESDELESSSAKATADLRHYEFIETGQIDPIPNLIKSLKQNIGETGSIIVWNKSFEATQNKRMGEIYPEYADFCENMNNRIFDLMEIFRDQLYADPKFKGSYSIKKVLPVLVPELTYEEMDIGDGATAMANWNEMVYGEDLSDKEREKIRKDLLKYCELDTLAMYEIYLSLVNL
jgi:hypothetical protein